MSLSKNRIIPKAERPTTELDRLVLALEVPNADECDCPRIRECRRLAIAEAEGEPDADCPGRTTHGACPEKTRPCPVAQRQPPCEHVLAADHDLSLEEWAELLALWNPEEYLDPPEDPLASVRATKDESLAVYELRYPLHAIRSPRDTTSVEEQRRHEEDVEGGSDS